MLRNPRHLHQGHLLVLGSRLTPPAGAQVSWATGPCASESHPPVHSTCSISAPPFTFTHLDTDSIHKEGLTPLPISDP